MLKMLTIIELNKIIKLIGELCDYKFDEINYDISNFTGVHIRTRGFNFGYINKELFRIYSYISDTGEYAIKNYEFFELHNPECFKKCAVLFRRHLDKYEHNYTENFTIYRG